MHRERLLIGIFVAALIGPTLAAQAPVSEMDAHINAAKAAAGLDSRAGVRHLRTDAAGRRRNVNRRSSGVAEE